ncbi:MAG: hypothetical protein ACK4YP_26825, partial [Myxococcota bacterium]
MEPLVEPWPMARVAPVSVAACAAECRPVQRLAMGPGWGEVVLWEREVPSPAPGPEPNVHHFVRIDTAAGSHVLDIGT